MKRVIAHLESVSAYSQSKPISEKKANRELDSDFEERIWRLRLHADDEGNVIIPGASFKLCLEEAAKYMSESVPGKGSAKYTKHFAAGILVPNDLPLGVKVADVHGEPMFVPSDGKRGGGKRVWKTFGIIPRWAGEVEFLVLDDIITEDVFARTLENAGKYIGIGRFRPIRGGTNGRFRVVKVEWDV